MRDKELWLNGSGYADPTAYKAMKGVLDMEIKAGQIWSTVAGRLESRDVLILAKNGDVLTVLQVTHEDNQHADTHFICGEDDLYSCSKMLQYCFVSKLEECLYTMSEEQYKYVMDKVSASLGIEFDDSEELECAREVIAAKNAEIKRLQEQFDAVIMEKNHEINNLSGELQDVILNEKPSEDMVRLETERDLYKSLYEQTLERLLSR